MFINQNSKGVLLKRASSIPSALSFIPFSLSATDSSLQAKQEFRRRRMQGPDRKARKTQTFLFIFSFLGLNLRDFENLKLLLHEVFNTSNVLMMIYVLVFSFVFGGRRK